MALTQISTAGVKDDAVTSGKIPANAVGSSEIAANAVGSSELADDAVDTAAIQDLAVTTAKIANNAITPGTIMGSAVTTAKIADQAVTLDKLPHGTSSNDGKFLRANNGADPTFETVTGTTINNNADNRVITGSGTANTLNGESNVVIDANGNVGIGTNSPNSFTNYTTLTINGGSDGAGIDLELNDNNIYGRFFADTTGLQIQTAQSGDSIRFETNGGNVRARITDDGLCFGSDSAAANALDDYEEGTWTPQIQGTSGAGTATYSEQTGRYIKIGKLVYLTAYINYTSGSAGGELRITNLPFSPTTNCEGIGNAMFYNIDIGSDTANISPYVGPNNSYIYFYQSRQGTHAWTTLNYDSAGAIIMNISFRVA